MKVLVVEDNEVNRDMIERRLKFRGYTVATAVDGLDGIEKAKEIRPDLILMDMSLPRLDGWEATKRLKADAETAKIPVIALTAHALKADRESTMEAGCDGFHAKPIQMDILVELMTQLAEKRS
jgi:two-component system, cell cycle response regulator DivK